jgi:arylformamidase
LRKVELLPATENTEKIAKGIAEKITKRSNMTVDFEVEYNNRARVPEHPEIFARWQREGAAYRAAAHNPKLGISYGPSSRRTIDLFPTRDDDKAPLAMFIHGGWWRSLEPASFSQMAAGPNGRGVSVAVVGYDLCPVVSIVDIIEQMRAACLALWRRRRQRILVYGHSAGGHLAACMTATDWKALAPDAPADLVPTAYAISGVFDLTPLTQISINEDLRLSESEARRISPLFWQVPAGRSLDAVVGALESNEFLRQSKTIVEAWHKNLGHTRYEEIAGTNHFTVIDPLNDPNSAMTARVAALAYSVNSITL